MGLSGRICTALVPFGDASFATADCFLALTLFPATPLNGAAKVAATEGHTSVVTAVSWLMLTGAKAIFEVLSRSR